MSEVDQREKRIRWVMRISKMNAWTITLIAGLFGLISLVSLSWVGVLVGGGVVGAGLMEMRGHKRLQAGEAGAREWMAGSQAWLLVCVLAYCGWRIASLDPDDPFAVLGGSEQIEELGGLIGFSAQAMGDLFIRIYTLVYGIVAVLTVVFQGGLGLYYWLKLGALEAAESTTP